MYDQNMRDPTMPKFQIPVLVMNKFCVLLLGVSVHAQSKSLLVPHSPILGFFAFLPLFL